jgi:glucokinase
MTLSERGTVLGVDVGGTKIALAPVDRAGRIHAPVLTQSSRTDDTEAFLSGLEAALRNALHTFAEADVRAVGLACAGTVDSERGVVVTSPNLPLREVPVASRMQKALGVPVVLENDANAAALGEVACGAAVGYRHVVMVTLGTGIGGGLILDGRPYHGAGGGAAELGHTIVCRDGELCACGTRGCWEMYASGKALQRFARDRAGSRRDDPDGRLAGLKAQGALDGEGVSRLALRDTPAPWRLSPSGRLVGHRLVGLVNAFNPEVVVVGGGVSRLGDLILEPAARMVRESALAPNRDQVRLVAAALGNDAGLVGGALAAWDRLVGAEG